MTDPETIQALTDAYEKKPTRFTDWEQQFVESVSGHSFLSEKQRETIQKILSEKSSSTSDKTAARDEIWANAEGCVRCTDGMVIMRKPFTANTKSSLFDYSNHDESQHYIECVFPCVCPRGVLKKEWQNFRLDALQASDDGWVTKERAEA